MTTATSVSTSPTAALVVVEAPTSTTVEEQERPLRQKSPSSLSLGLSQSSETSKLTDPTATASSYSLSASSLSDDDDDHDDDVKDLRRVVVPYAPTGSKSAQMALASLQERLRDRDHCQDLRLESMKESFDANLLTEFYHQLMIPNFPLEEERDALEDWMLCLDPSLQQQQDEDDDASSEGGPSMDVLILCSNNNDNDNDTIIGGIAFEYYPKAQAGLLSYMVVNTNFRRLGILATLHPVFCEALQALHETSSSALTNTPIAAILAETNTTTAGDVSPEVARKRHEILYKLGYRLLEFPYVQPPLATDVESFDDIMLLVYVGRQDKDDSTTANNTMMDTRVLYDYVLDFYYSVFGMESLDFQDHWYYRLVSWYATKYPITRIQQSLPWDDVTPRMRTLMDKEVCKEDDGEDVIKRQE